MLTKICNSCDPPTEWPLTEEFFYKNRFGADGYQDHCKKCQRKIVLKNYYKKVKNKQKIFDINGKSKVPKLPEIKIKQKQLSTWNRNKELIIVLRCRSCSKLHEIFKKYHNKNCDCGRNILCFGTVNHLWSSIIWKNKLLENYDISKFDKWK